MAEKGKTKADLQPHGHGEGQLRDTTAKKLVDLRSVKTNHDLKLYYEGQVIDFTKDNNFGKQAETIIQKSSLGRIKFIRASYNRSCCVVTEGKK